MLHVIAPLAELATPVVASNNNLSPAVCFGCSALSVASTKAVLGKTLQALTYVVTEFYRRNRNPTNQSNNFQLTGACPRSGPAPGLDSLGGSKRWLVLGDMHILDQINMSLPPLPCYMLGGYSSGHRLLRSGCGCGVVCA